MHKRFKIYINDISSALTKDWHSIINKKSKSWIDSSLRNQVLGGSISHAFFPVFVRPSPFFSSFTVEIAFPDIGSVGRSVGRSDWKKKTPNLKKNHKKSRNSRPWYPRTTLKVNIHIFGLTKCTMYCEKYSCFCSMSFSMLLLCSFFRSIEKWCNYVVSVFFFLKMPKIWVGRTMVNGEKKEDGLNQTVKMFRNFFVVRTTRHKAHCDLSHPCRNQHSIEGVLGCLAGSS